MTASQHKTLWMRRDCPTWCIREHKPFDSGQENRACSSDPVPDLPSGVPMSLWNAQTSASGVIFLPTINVALEQMPREFEPRIIVSHEGSSVTDLTVNEAKSLLSLLGERIDIAERGMREVTP